MAIVTLTNQMLLDLMKNPAMSVLPGFTAAANSVKTVKGCKCSSKARKLTNTALDIIKSAITGWNDSQKTKFKSMINAEKVRVYTAKGLLEF